LFNRAGGRPEKSPRRGGAYRRGKVKKKGLGLKSVLKSSKHIGKNGEEKAPMASQKKKRLAQGKGAPPNINRAHCRKGERRRKKKFLLRGERGGGLASAHFREEKGGKKA